MIAWITAALIVVIWGSNVVDRYYTGLAGILSNLYYKAHHLQKLKCFSPRLAVVFAQFLEAAPTGDAPTTSEWSAIFIAYWGATYIRGLKVYHIYDIFFIQQGKTFEELVAEIGQENVGISSLKDVSNTQLGLCLVLCSIDVLSTYERFHDDVIKWKHFPRYWPFVREIPRSPVNSPHKGQRRRALMFSLICASINSWVNSHENGNLRRHRAHYDVTVMSWVIWRDAICWLMIQGICGLKKRE